MRRHQENAGDHQCNKAGQHGQAFPGDRHAPAPAIALCGKPVRELSDGISASFKDLLGQNSDGFWPVKGAKLAECASTRSSVARSSSRFLLLSLRCFIDMPVAANAAEASRISKDLCEDMKNHKTLTDHGPVGCDRLASVKFSYFGFDGRVHADGEIIVLDAVAARVGRIFDRLLDFRFPLKQARPINRYEGDDDASMADNNTSSFNDRPVVRCGWNKPVDACLWSRRRFKPGAESLFGRRRREASRLTQWRRKVFE